MRFDAAATELREDCIVSNVYVNRAAAAKLMGIADLNKVGKVKVTVEIEE